MVHRSDLFIFGKKRPNGNPKRESERKRQIGREVDVERESERTEKIETKKRGIFGSKWLRDFLLWGPINVGTRRKGGKSCGTNNLTLLFFCTCEL